MIPIELRSVGNIRDLGGTRMKDGSVIRCGCLIRSAHLGYAVQADVQQLRNEYRLSKIIDLRTGGERSELPDHSFGVENLRLPIFPEFKAGISHEAQEEKKSDLPRMEDLYRFIMTDTACVTGFRNILKAIFTHDYRKGSVLWHCSEGKDRCGMTAALVLTALGADRETILEDYLETNKVNIPKARAMYEQVLAEKSPAVAEKIYQAYIADKNYLYAAWEVMGDNYLRDMLGFNAAQIRKFRAQVLEE
jgi:protein-tyrosine phosphatase